MSRDQKTKRNDSFESFHFFTYKPITLEKEVIQLKP